MLPMTRRDALARDPGMTVDCPEDLPPRRATTLEAPRDATPANR
jgi:hypothetical protein